MDYLFQFIDLWPYFLLGIIFLIPFEPKKSSIIYLTLLLFIIFRYDVGWDYTAYVEEILISGKSILDSRYEPISSWILYAGYLTDFPPLTFIIFGWSTIFFIKKVIDKHSCDHQISWVLYLVLPLFFLASLSTIRQSLSTSIVFFSYLFLPRKKYVFLILIVISTMIHYSGLVGILIYPLQKFQFGKKQLWGILILSIFISPLIKMFIQLFSEYEFALRYFQFYIQGDRLSSTKLPFLYNALGFIALFYYSRLTSANDRNKTIIQITTFGLVLFNCFSFEPVTASRISAFFLLFWILLFPDFVEFFKQRNLARYLIIVTSLFILFFYLSIYIRAYQNKVISKISFIPYKTWIFK